MWLKELVEAECLPEHTDFERGWRQESHEKWWGSDTGDKSLTEKLDLGNYANLLEGGKKS